jgi:hypothetical protein
VDFIALKKGEAGYLDAWVAELVDMKFENHLGKLAPRSLTGGDLPTLLLSLGGAPIGRAKRPLQANMEAAAGAAENNDGDVDAGKDGESSIVEEEDEDDDVWFENQIILDTVKQSCTALRQQHILALEGTVKFAVASIAPVRAHRERPSRLTSATLR